MIPAFDYLRGHARLGRELEAAMGRVISSGHLILGPECAAFESEFAEYVGSRAAVSTGSGTSAIVIALRALGIGAGDEVITVSHTAVPTVGAIREAGASPRLVDVEEGSLLIDPGRVAEAIGPRTRAVVPVHLYGCPAEMPAIVQIASRYNLAVIEDCAQAHGARIEGRHVGTFGTIGCFSFYPTKNLGAYGDGGLCVTDDLQLAERMRRLRFHGFDETRAAQLEGMNSRLDELQAAILRVKLRHLDEALSARRSIARQYRELLQETGVRLPEMRPGREHAWHLFVIRTSRRDLLMKAFQRSGIGFGIHYPRPVHRMPAYGGLGYGPGSLPITESAADEVLSLPMFPELTAQEVESVCGTIQRTWGDRVGRGLCP